MGSSPCVCPRNSSARAEQWSPNAWQETLHAQELKNKVRLFQIPPGNQGRGRGQSRVSRADAVQSLPSSGAWEQLPCCTHGLQRLFWAAQGGHWVPAARLSDIPGWLCSSPTPAPQPKLEICSPSAGLGMSACPGCSPGQPLTVSPF